ncbi:putative cytochrome c peroxidase [Flavobacterium cauense R2A-7]|uniref:Cytochrome c peroxidase n=1 Tax=Flavobacterium cauense R2A-7 TaxID=1341154 RepID=V6RXE1_9FLAO|nr:cytochrome c peroxidase [Flavobacterium cauense]ESU18844.1 putative cytochrome c peroxidase [Flavobacterium cauense R2A-7]KGO81689.1 cytochrome C peroxidase [Flavobacterium cauense R2A-7]TWI13717.1 cytochrome c peroxidase [Flavobacterium cauense R2A-7]
MRKALFLTLSTAVLFVSCNNQEDNYVAIPSDNYPNVEATFGNTIDLTNLSNYANQVIPPYITKDNSALNPVTDKGATLGRVLFYDKNLSSNNTISCASCHQQANAFSDTNVASNGVNGTTGRHAMRLINTRFANESKFFWDERAASLEIQSTMPIKNHGEMGFSGVDGDLNFDALITRLNAIGYYKELFEFVYGTEEITEVKIQNALAQFIRSIQSFDSKYDSGRALVANDNQPFPNFTAQENQGKNLFLTPPVFDGTGSRTGGGIGCAGCHAAPEFDINPITGNNGIIGVLNGTGIDITNTRAPSLRDLVKTDGTTNGPMMHTGVITSLQAAIGHYGTINIAPGNTNLDPKLTPGGNGQRLNLNANEVNAVIAFLRTLSGTNVYTDNKWSNPFSN